MSRAKLSIIRAIRIQLKSGYLKTEPESYTFLKRYPPIHRDNKLPFHKMETRNIPYLELLEKMDDRNVDDARVYPAYWQQEPTRLTLAKKQYQFMAAGDDEETAFQKAEAYVDQLENKSFVDLMNLRDALKTAGAQAPFMQNTELANEILMWKEKLQTTMYYDLDIADQGEIDYLIQTKIMKWNEVERERRMKDPVFVKQFRKIRKLIFPENSELAKEKKLMKDTEQQAKAIDEMYHVDYTQFHATSLFYLNDYIHFFKLLQNEPNVRKWNQYDYHAFTTWIIDTLAIKEITDKSTNAQVRVYLETLKHQFFPMTLSTDKTKKYEIPTIDELRQLLYENDIGYKTMNDKVYVRRFYKIPMLLFPVETMSADVAQNTELLDQLHAEEDETDLLQEIQNAGLESSVLPTLKSQLNEYRSQRNMYTPSDHATNDKNNEFDMTALDALINDAACDLKDDPVNSKPSLYTSTTSTTTSTSSTTNKTEINEKEKELMNWLLDEKSDNLENITSHITDDDSDFTMEESKKILNIITKYDDNELMKFGKDNNLTLIEVKEFINELKESINNNNTTTAATTNSTTTNDITEMLNNEIDDHDDDNMSKNTISEPISIDFKKLHRQYCKPAVTELDLRRDKLYETNELFQNAKNEVDLKIIRDARSAREFEYRVRLEALYIEKEQARRERNWKKQNMWKMPRPLIPVIGINEI